MDCISSDRQGLPVPRPDKHSDKVVVVDNNNESPLPKKFINLMQALVYHTLLTHRKQERETLWTKHEACMYIASNSNIQVTMRKLKNNTYTKTCRYFLLSSLVIRSCPLKNVEMSMRGQFPNT